MTSFRSHHAQVLSAGVVVERLPLGHAAGRWWAMFVYGMPDGGSLPGEWPTLCRSAWVHDPEGRLDPVSGSGGGNHVEQEYTWELVDLPAAEVEQGDDDQLTLPHRRFVRLRTDPPLDVGVGPCTIGGEVHWFGMDVPDTVDALAVDYLTENDVVASELVPLPDLRD